MPMHYFHVIETSNQDRPVFSEPAVLTDCLHALERVVPGDIQIGAYAFMSAHVHLLVGVVEPSALGPAIRRVFGPTAWCLNRRLQQRGGIFQRAFWRAPVRNADYLAALPLYIHANPCPQTTSLRRLCVGARSSHEAMMSGVFPAWLTPGEVYHQYAGGYAAAMQVFLEDRVGQVSPDRALTAREEWITGVVARHCGTRPRTLLDSSRGGKRDRMLLAHALAAELGQRDAARLMGIHRSTAAAWIRIAHGDPMSARVASHLRPAGVLTSDRPS